jgi:hypothetical protein
LHEKLEIHKVFLRFSGFVSRKICSPIRALRFNQHFLLFYPRRKKRGCRNIIANLDKMNNTGTKKSRFSGENLARSEANSLSVKLDF